MCIIQHDPHGGGSFRRGRQEATNQRMHGRPGRTQPVEDDRVQRPQVVERDRHVAEERDWVIVAVVHHHPGEWIPVVSSQLRERRGLPIPRRRHDRDEPPVACCPERMQQGDPSDAAGAWPRDAELGVLQALEEGRSPG